MMNNEEIERKMNFIVEQQAQFASDIQRLELAQARTEQVVAHTVQVVGHTAEIVDHAVQAVARSGEVVERLAKVTHAGFTDVNAKINALIDAQMRTEANLARTEANVADTDERLKALIALVDRQNRQRKNGK